MNNFLSSHIDPNKIFIINRSEIEGRWDPSVYKNIFVFTSRTYSEYKLSEVALINPNTSFRDLDDNSEITFIPMDAIDETNGIVTKTYYRKVSEHKGYTKFKEGDLIWAKITPCMQNGNSAIIRNAKQGYGFGSTEFFVIRPKNDNVLIEYIYILLRDQRILNNAMNYFGGSAGQQRVPKEFLINFRFPLPPIEIQQKVINIYTDACVRKQQKEAEGTALLASIDDYLLRELGLTLPEQNNSLNGRIFTPHYREVTNGRFDPDYHSLKYKQLIQSICSSHYQTYPLGCLTSVLSSGKTPARDEYTEIDATYPIIKVGSYTDDFIDISKAGYTIRPQLLKAQKGDIFILSAAHQSEYVGKHIKYLNEQPCCDTSYVGELICARSNNTCNSMFLFSVLNMPVFKVLINREKTGQTSHVYGKDLRNILIPLPPLEKQDEIAKHIQSIRNQACSLQKEAQEILEKAKKEVEQMILEE